MLLLLLGVLVDWIIRQTVISPATKPTYRTAGRDDNAAAAAAAVKKTLGPDADDDRQTDSQTNSTYL